MKISRFAPLALLCAGCADHGSSQTAHNVPDAVDGGDKDAPEGDGKTSPDTAPDTDDDQDGGVSLDLVEIPCLDESMDYPAPACSGVCGNGIVDSCLVPCDPRNPMCKQVSESCDGSLPAGTSCESTGYLGGSLRCGAWCDLDFTGCTTCETNLHVTRCIERFLNAGRVYKPSMAGDDISTALFFGGSRQFHLGVVEADLAPVGTERCYKAVTQKPTESVVNAGTIARIASGWLVALQSTQPSSEPADIDRVTLVSLDREGHRQGPAKSIVGAQPLRFVERHDGSPLMLSVGGPNRNIDARLLDDEGNAVWRTGLEPSASVIPHVAGVDTGSGFLLAMLTRIADNKIGLRTIKLGLDGAVASSQVLAEFPGGDPELAWSGNEARIAWIHPSDSTSAAQVVWARLDESGALLGAPTVIATGSYAGATPLVAGPFGTVAVLGGYTGAGGVALGLSGIGIDNAGNVHVPLYPLTKNPHFLVGWQIRVMGANVIATWSEPVGEKPTYPGRIGIVRITP